MWHILIMRLLVVLSLISTAGCGSPPRHESAPAIQDLVEHYDDVFREYLSEASREMGKDIVRYEPIAADVIPRRVTIRGTQRELGTWLGLMAKKHYGDAGRVKLRRNPEDEEINRRIIAMYETIHPPYLDLVRGVASAFDMTLDEVDLRQLEHEFLGIMWGELLQYGPFMSLTDFSSMGQAAGSNCSIVSHYAADQKNHFIGRNFDNPSDRPFFVTITDLEGGYRTLGCACYFLYHWIADGINEKGLFIGIATNAIPEAYNEKEPEYPEEPAVQVCHMMRIALETCETVEEALERFRSVRIWFPCEGNHLLIADASGDAAVVEFDRERNVVSFRRTEPYLVLTNTAYQEGFEYVRERCSRFRTAQEALETRAPLQSLEAVREMTRLMRLTNGGGRTLWTSFYDIAERQMDLRVRSEGFRIPHTFTLE